MGSWYETFRDMHDDGASETPVERVAMTLLPPQTPSEVAEMQTSTITSSGERVLFRFRARWLLMPVFLWLLGYISGLFPYVGAYAYNSGNGDLTYALQTPSPRVMPLFKGQVAFIDYKFEPRPRSQSRIYLDIKPWPGMAHTKHRLIVLDKSEGRLAVPITQTDIYQFTFSFGSAVKNEEAYYSVTWGAR